MVSALGFTLFETAIGSCGIAWGDCGVVGAQLPEADEGGTRLRMRRRFPDVAEMQPPVDVQHAIESIVALLRGEPRDLSEIVLDMDRVQPFHRRVYEVARTIPPGSTLSYGDVAKRLGEPGVARAVGQALGQNPFAPIVPCHRVLAGDGTMHGFSARGGVATKLRLLTIEGWRATEPTLFDISPA
jgi:methylated-DNA-[protein]-cysteine S-methyltransferase